MQIELKNISFNERLSQETNAYAADIWVDGKKFASVENDGHGGCDLVIPAKGLTWGDVKALEAKIGAEYPARTIEGFPPMKADLESVCCSLLADHIERKHLRREMGRKVLYSKPGEEGLWTIPTKQHSPAVVIAHVQKTYPGAVILNALPEAEALAMWRRLAA